MTRVCLAWLLCLALPAHSQDELRAEQQAESIDACLKLPAKPAVPEEATRRFVRGATMAKLAKSADEFRAAAAEYRAGLLLAPCVSDAYFNYALVLELAGERRQTLEALQLYLRAAPNAPDAARVRAKIYEMEAALEMRQRRAPATVYIYRNPGFAGSGLTYVIVSQGRTLGALKIATFLAYQAPPGELQLGVIERPYDEVSTTAAYTIEAGKTYYLELSWGFLVPSLRLADEKEGAAALEALKRQ
jgi:tetratricopeptide (TPR) repeat protein